MKRAIIGLAMFMAAAGAVRAAPVNLLVNGSFEDGLNGWAATGTQQFYPPAVIVTDGVSGTAFGEAVPADTIVGGSPDAAGTHGVYFVDDLADQRLTQQVWLDAGSYLIGFDAYAPLNGFNNSGDAYFTGTIAGVLLASYSVHTQNDPQQWLHYSGLANVLSAGFYEVTFTYQTSLVPSADVVVDRVFIVASDQGGGTPIGEVPEPASLALLGLGLAGLGAARRRPGR